MVMPPRLTIVGDHERPDHSHLPASAKCYFWGEYTPKEHITGHPWDFSATNQLIFNFKKKPGLQGQQYKRAAINQVAQAFAAQWRWAEMRQHRAALIPIPPSRARTDPLFDPRMCETLATMANTVGGVFDIRDCLSFSGVYAASHIASARPTPDDLYRELSFDPMTGRAQDQPGVIMLFDDILTTGAHFVAASRRLGEAFPGVLVVGVFIARRVIPNPFADAFDFNSL